MPKEATLRWIDGYLKLIYLVTAGAIPSLLIMSAESGFKMEEVIVLFGVQILTFERK